MAVKLEFAKIELVRDINKEYFELSNTIYTPFAPFQPTAHGYNALKRGRYLPINPLVKDKMCYIKVKNQDLFLYMENGKLVFRKVYCDKNGFTFKQPLIVWISYIREPTFLLYIPREGYGGHTVDYLKYDYNVKTNKLKIKLVRDVYDATSFSFQHKNWHAFLAKSKDLISGV